MIEREEGGECSIEVDEDDWSCDTRKIADRMECSRSGARRTRRRLLGADPGDGERAAPMRRVRGALSVTVLVRPSRCAIPAGDTVSSELQSPSYHPLTSTSGAEMMDPPSRQQVDSMHAATTRLPTRLDRRHEPGASGCRRASPRATRLVLLGCGGEKAQESPSRLRGFVLTTNWTFLRPLPPYLTPSTSLCMPGTLWRCL